MIAPPTRGSTRLRPVLAAAAVWSGLHLLLALHWLLDPGSWPGLDGGAGNHGAGVLTLLTPGATSWALLLVAAAGLAVAATAWWHRPSAGLVGAAGVVAVAAAVLSADMRVLALLGYLCAIVGPAAAAVVLVVGGARSRRAWPWLAALAVLVAVGLGSGLLQPDNVARLAREMAPRLGEEVALRGSLALLLAGAAVWSWATVLLRRVSTGACTDCGGPAARAALQRWGRTATWVAALCPLPYALVRATWLTPWPVGLPSGDTLEPAIRLFGLTLGAAALGGAVLTVGLLRPWGQVWPSWIPVLRGRPVPVRFPVIAGGLVAVVLLAATPGLAGPGISGLLAGDLHGAAFLVLFPTLPWGLALGIAVLAHAQRRRGACTACEHLAAVRP